MDDKNDKPVDQFRNEESSTPPDPPFKPIPRPPQVGDMVHPFSQLNQNTYVTYTLLAIIGVIFVVQYGQQTGSFGTFDAIWCTRESKILHDWAGCGPAMVEGGQLWRLFTLMFLHGNPTHIAFNAIALYSLGMDMERIYGQYRFLFIYIFGGLFGSLLSFAVRGSDEFTVGASGAIFAIAGMNLSFFYMYRDKLGDMGEQRFQSMLRMVGINLVIGFLLIRVNNLGHIGGLIGGILLGYMFIPWYTVTETIPSVEVSDQNSLTVKSVQALSIVLTTVGLALAIWYYWRFL
ncbi:MAG: rhomboid family intramembrane serine protease [Anaerolineae bacterium]